MVPKSIQAGYARVAVIAYTGPANGNPARRPSKDYYYQSDNYLRHALAQKLMEEIGQAQANTMYFFDELPSGLVGWENQRPVAEGSRNSGTIDRFIYGHPNGPFETLDRAYDHIKFLYYYGTPSRANACPCHRCTKKRTKAETGVVRTRTPVPCPQAQVTSVRAIPDDLRRLKLAELVNALSTGDQQNQKGQSLQHVQNSQHVQQAQHMQQPQSVQPAQHVHHHQSISQHLQQSGQLLQVPQSPLLQARHLQQAQQLRQIQQTQHFHQLQQAHRQTRFQAVSTHPQAFYRQTMSTHTQLVQQQSAVWGQTAIDPQLTASPTSETPGRGRQEMSPGIMKSPVPRNVVPGSSRLREDQVIKRQESEIPEEALSPSRRINRSKGKKRALDEHLDAESEQIEARKRWEPEPSFQDAPASVGAQSTYSQLLGIGEEEWRLEDVSRDTKQLKSLPAYIEGFEWFPVATDSGTTNKWGSSRW